MIKSCKSEEGIVTKGLIKIFKVVFLIAFIWFFFNILFFNTNDLIHFRMIRSTFVGLAFLGVLIASYMIIDKIGNKVQFVNKHFNITMGIVIILMFIAQVIFFKMIYFDPGWDVSAVIGHAENLSANPSAFDADYFMQYPNNLFLLKVFNKIFLLCNFSGAIDYKFVLVIINIFMVDLALWFMVLSCKRLFGKKLAISAFLLFSTLFAFSSWLNVPYSDTLSMVFPVLIFYLFLIYKDSNSKLRKIILIVGISAIAVIGIKVKPTTIIVVIAIGISEILLAFRQKEGRLKTIGTILLLIFISGTISITINKISSPLVVNGINVEDNVDKSVPFTHFIMIGMQSDYIENRGYQYGVYSEDDLKYTLRLGTKKEKIDGNIVRIKERLNGFGPTGYIKFLFDKLNWILSDGTFYYGGEGNFMISAPYDKSETAKKLQNVFLLNLENKYLHNQENYFNLANVIQGFWILILGLIVVAAFYLNTVKSGKDPEEWLLIIEVTITGILVFLMFFEGRSRYLINHIPFFIMLATYGFSKIYKGYRDYVRVK